MKILSEKFSTRLIFAGLILEILCVILFVYKSNLFDFNFAIQADKFGQLGDTVSGLVGSLWALAGVVLFYISLKEQRQVIATSELSLVKQNEALEMQRSELELQRKEYERSREGFDQQKIVYEEQSKTIRTQQFESNYYALLDVYIKIRNSLDASTEEKDFFANLYNNMTNEFVPCATHQENFLAARILYENTYFENKGKLSHYLKTIYRIIKIIDDSSLTSEQKYFYSKIVRSQFTEFELFILYYNSQTQYGEKFYPLILRYNLLKHLPILTKLEFKQLDTGLTLIQSQVLLFQTWLDLFLEQYLNSYSNEIDDISLGTYLKSQPCNIVEGLILEIKITSKIELTFYFTNTLPANEDVFSNFIEAYLYDRLFYSRYLDVKAEDNISVMKGNYGPSFRACFNIESNQELKICDDLY